MGASQRPPEDYSTTFFDVLKSFLSCFETATETDAWKHSGSHNSQNIKMYETVLAQCSPICNHSFQVVCRGLWLVFQVSTTDPLQHSLTRTWMGANTSSLELQLVDQMAQLVPFGRKSRRGSQTHLLNKICFNIVSTKTCRGPSCSKIFLKQVALPEKTLVLWVPFCWVPRPQPTDLPETITDEKVILWAQRAFCDWRRKAPVGSTIKQEGLWEIKT